MVILVTRTVLKVKESVGIIHFDDWSVCLAIRLPISLVCLWLVYLSVSLSVSLSSYQSVCLSVCLSLLHRALLLTVTCDCSFLVVVIVSGFI